MADWGGGLETLWEEREQRGREKSALLEKRKHNLIPALFELGTTCSLLKQLVWLFIIFLLTTKTHAHMEKCFMCCSEEFVDVFFVPSYSPR